MWQHSETAPVGVPVKVGRYRTAYTNPNEIVWEQDVGIVWEWQNFLFWKRKVRNPSVRQYTHWMPLPEPPQ